MVTCFDCDMELNRRKGMVTKLQCSVRMCQVKVKYRYYSRRKFSEWWCLGAELYAPATFVTKYEQTSILNSLKKERARMSDSGCSSCAPITACITQAFRQGEGAAKA